MKIYELIYYWDDCAYGCDISSTILVKSQEEVENYEKIFIAKYKNGGKCYNILDGGLHSIVNTSKKFINILWKENF